MVGSLRENAIKRPCARQLLSTALGHDLRNFIDIVKMGLNPKGRDWSLLVNWDSLGKAYTSVAIAWTVVLGVGMLWLIKNRQLPSIKIRNIALAIAATAVLHVYLVKILLAYTTNGHFPCSAEFWIMSIYLPSGIALFQANMVQLLSISDQQRLLLTAGPASFQEKPVAPQTWSGRVHKRWHEMTTAHKAYIFIGIGMIVQVSLITRIHAFPVACRKHNGPLHALTSSQLVVTAAVFASSPTLKGDWSSYGKVTHARGQALCRRSQEWYVQLEHNVG